MRALALVLLMLLGCGRALAADGAAFNAIGYSPDSRYFAFEQYGVQDGSGFPYWDVFVIDLKTNEWVKGSPYRALLESEEAKLAAARDQARGRRRARAEGARHHRARRTHRRQPGNRGGGRARAA